MLDQTTKPRHHTKLTQSEVIRVHRAMEALIEPVGEGFARYKDGWDDVKVADHLGVSEGSVANLRRNVWGNFPPVVKPPAPTTIVDRVEALERAEPLLAARVAELEAEVKGLVDKLKLIQHFKG